MKTTKLGPFLGINNRRPDFDLHVEKQGDFVRQAINVDVDDTQHFRRRSATELIQAMTAPHSLFKNYMVRASALYSVTLPTYSETLVTILNSNAKMSWCEINGDLFFSNGTDSGRITNGALYPWALPTPTSPNVATIGGTLYEGWYQVAVSYVNSTTGEEGGIGPSSNYQLIGTGGLRVSLPGTTPGATHVNIYVSTVNGAVPMLQTTVTAGTTLVDIVSLVDGREAFQRYDAPLPAGTRIFEFNSCLCSVVGKRLYIGLPGRYGYYLPVYPHPLFPENISTAIGGQTGMYVAADKTYFFAGTDPAQIEMVMDVLPYGAVPGTEFMSPDRTLVGWFGNKGFVLAKPGGELEAVMSENVDPYLPVSGCSTILQTRGYRRVVSCGYCMNLANKAVTTYAGWDFTSTSEGYGTQATGVFKLEGTGTVANWLIDFGKIDFGAEQKKHLPAVYLNCSSDDLLSLRVELPSGATYDYAARSYSSGLEMNRVDPGKGLRENWFGLSLLNETGCDFTLAAVSFAPVGSTRRI